MTDDAELQRKLYDVYDDTISQLLSLPIYVDRDGVDTVLGSDFETAVNNLAMARDHIGLTAHSISMEDLRLALRVPRRALRLYIQENHVPTFYTFDGEFVHKHHLPQLLYAVARAREEMRETFDRYDEAREKVVEELAKDMD